MFVANCGIVILPLQRIPPCQFQLVRPASSPAQMAHVEESRRATTLPLAIVAQSQGTVVIPKHIVALDAKRLLGLVL